MCFPIAESRTTSSTEWRKFGTSQAQTLLYAISGYRFPASRSKKSVNETIGSWNPWLTLRLPERLQLVDPPPSFRQWSLASRSCYDSGMACAGPSRRTPREHRNDGGREPQIAIKRRWSIMMSRFARSKPRFCRRRHTCHTRKHAKGKNLLARVTRPSKPAENKDSDARSARAAKFLGFACFDV
jgi:hypothetical protein